MRKPWPGPLILGLATKLPSVGLLASRSGLSGLGKGVETVLFACERPSGQTGLEFLPLHMGSELGTGAGGSHRGF